MLILLIVTGIVALVLGYLYFMATGRQRALQAEVSAYQERYAQLEAKQGYLQHLVDDKQQLAREKQEQLERLNEEFASLMAEQGRLAEQNKYLHQQLQSEKERLHEMHQDFKAQFENTAQQLLQRISGNFMQQNQVKMDDLLKPLAEKIDNFRSSVQQSLVAETSQRTELKAELQRLLQLNQTLSKEANNLTRALKADTKKQGNWGEMILEKVLEASGLEKGIHYVTQDAQRDDTGQLRLPDMVLQLPENRQIVIDSKVSLKAYEQYCSATEEAERQQALKLHVQSVKNHVNELSRKAYHTLYKNTTDFVMLFIPIEPAYGLAVMQQDEDLYDFAFRRKVILVSVPSLLATLRIIDAMWRLDNQNRNAEEIVRQGSALYDKFVGFAEDMGMIGEHLKRSQGVYENAMNKLSTGHGNLVGRAERMRKLGLENKKSLPRQLIADIDMTQEEEADVPAAGAEQHLAPGITVQRPASSDEAEMQDGQGR
ncbi:DNA recombination protein RmuC [Chitinophaga oryzae]|uniref:DNA recombination protein RmuC n=1 Tax=Chitinophaga oryzae TaxID=2725414 RepID=A0AAE6ZM96_9BACT|nr:DNA recombination protein RmuC [Chitinophaga oryzae]QJB34390.1 DNA recombination protein RmuC [Chitinophaga oryzae]QJB40909.1 DNA recombination protein RmuC [Chitinophaga oryzae]